MRYLGQTVAKLTCNDTATPRLSTGTCERANKDYFDCELLLRDCPWDGEEARAFRSYFKQRHGERHVNGDNPRAGEARIRSLLLTEFSTPRLRNIRPVEIAGFRYAMPTPLCARTMPGEVSYAGSAGGGIDILARCGVGIANLCVVEVKSEGASTAQEAMEQAVKHTVFIRELLRSSCGADWRKVFGFRSPVPQNLTLLAVCAMPVPDTNKVQDADKSFGCTEYAIDGDDKVQMHYLYFKEANDKILDAITSLPIEIQDDAVPPQGKAGVEETARPVESGH
ncbi:MAG: hypothetical protein LBB40_02255 [Holophagales bacterium]|nr:hypothetical protein [Holophagales bacterium]